MNVLKENGIELTWQNCYVGFKKQWLKRKELVDFANTNLNDSSLEDLIIQLNVSEDEEYNLILDILEKIIFRLYKKKISIDDELWTQNIRLWQLGFLINIKKINVPIKEKLRKIAELWEHFDYPDEWRVFIYYLTPDQFPLSSEGYRESYVYNKFLDFVVKEKNCLK